MDEADFYEMLDLSPSASDDAINEAIRSERRTWIRRQNAPDAQRRAEAELRVAHLDEAEQVLLDPAKRRAYDARWSRHREQRQQQQHQERKSERSLQTHSQRMENSDLLAGAEDYLDAGNPRLAHEVATDATRVDRHNARAWATRGLASMQLDDFEQAESELREALRQEPKNTAYALQLAYCYLNLGWHDQADHTLRELERSDPGDVDVRILRAQYYLATEQPDTAYGTLLGLMEVRHEDHTIAELLAHAHRDMVLARLTMPRENFFMFTNRAQIAFAREHLGRAQALAFDNGELRSDIARWLDLANDAAGRVWVRRPAGGVLRVFVVLLVLIVAASASVNRPGLASVLVLVLVVVAPTVWVARRWRPQWKINRAVAKREGALRWGI